MVANKLNASCFVPLGGRCPVEVTKLKKRAQELQEVGSLCDEVGRAQVSRKRSLRNRTGKLKGESWSDG